MHVEDHPFKYAIIENFLPLDFANKIYRELRDLKPNESWYQYESPFEKKLATDKWVNFPGYTKKFLQSTFTSMMINEIEKRFEIEGLVGDPALRGGGIHMHEPGGFLDIHADFNIHPKLKLHRRMNGILFINRDWEDEWGGCLEFWSKDMKTCEKKIAPKFNRLVLFEITDDSYHGLPEPVKCPEGHRRMSLAFYLYSGDRPEDQKSQAHSTLFKARPGDTTTPDIELLRAQRGKGRLNDNVKS